MTRILAQGLHFRRTGSTKRAVKVDGVIGEPVVFLSGLECTDPIPADPSGLTGLQESNVVQTLTSVFHVFVSGATHDIEAGDWLTVGGADYAIRLAQPFKNQNALTAFGYYRLTVEKMIT